jgi:hypothetical protein
VGHPFADAQQQAREVVAWLESLPTAPADIDGVVGGGYPTGNEGAGKLPSERYNELCLALLPRIERGELDGLDPTELTFGTLLKVLDERLGRAP